MDLAALLLGNRQPPPEPDIEVEISKADMPKAVDLFSEAEAIQKDHDRRSKVVYDARRALIDFLYKAYPQLRGYVLSLKTCYATSWFAVGYKPRVPTVGERNVDFVIKLRPSEEEHILEIHRKEWRCQEEEKFHFWRAIELIVETRGMTNIDDGHWHLDTVYDGFDDATYVYHISPPDEDNGSDEESPTPEPAESREPEEALKE